MKILSARKSSIGTPYVYYDVNAVYSERTTTSVKISVKITAWLGTTASYLGNGYTLTGHISFMNGQEYSIAIKGSSDWWEGTTKHYTELKTYTITGLNPTDTLITGIKFRVSARNSDDSGTLSTVSCTSLPIEIGHTPPQLTLRSVKELNSIVIAALGDEADNTIVPLLSTKRLIYDVDVYDNSTLVDVELTDYSALQGQTWSYEEESAGKWRAQTTISFHSATSYPITDDGKIRLTCKVKDSLDVESELESNIDAILYFAPTFIPTQCGTVRTNQVTGDTNLYLKGKYFGNNIGLSGNSLKIYYKTWEKAQNEPPDSFYTEISTISYNENDFGVNGYELGDEFELDKVYNIKVKVVDDFGFQDTIVLTILSSKYVWAEFSDHVDFEKITIKGEEVLPGGGTDVVITDGTKVQLIIQPTQPSAPEEGYILWVDSDS